MDKELSQEHLERNVKLFVWFRVLFNARFYYPIFAVFFTDMGLSVSQFLWLNALWAVTIVLFELPSGVLADLVGRRKLVIFSAVSMMVEMLLLIVAPQGAGWWLFAVCAVNRVLSGLAEAAASGAYEALAYDSVKLIHREETEREKRWDHVLVATMRWRSLAMIVAMLVGGYVFDYEKMSSLLGDFPKWVSLKLPVILCFISSIFCVVMAWRLTDLGLRKKASNERTHVKDIWHGVLEAVSWVRTCKWIAAIIVGGLLIDSIARTFVTLQSTYFRYIDLPEYSFGIIGAAMSLSGWVVPLYVKKLTEFFSPRVNFLIAGLVSFVGLLGVVLFPNVWGIIPSFFIMLGLMQVGFLLSRYINQSAPSEIRASILSVNNLTLNIGYCVFSLGIGLAMSEVAKTSGENTAFAHALEWMAVGSISSLLVWFVASRAFRKID
jgi:MFS family permease